jgi:hypothetical protein
LSSITRVAARRAGATASCGADEREQHAARKRRERGYDESHMPACILQQRAGHDGRQRDTHVAREAVHANRQARSLRALDEHRDADRVVDRGEYAEHRQCRTKLPRGSRKRDEQRRDTHAEEEHEHHPPPAPQVAEPSGGQRTQPEHRERADTVRHQVLPAREPEIGGDRCDCRRENQQEHVVERMRHVQQHAGCPRGRLHFIVMSWRCSARVATSATRAPTQGIR